MYALYFLLVTITCVVMMSPTVEQAIKTHVSDTKLTVGPFKYSNSLGFMFLIPVYVTSVPLCW